jgi:chromosome segregation ATPase
VLSADLQENKVKVEELSLSLGTLQVHHKKLQDSNKQLHETYDDTCEKLHKMNKARHDLETKLTDEIERNRALQDIVRIKEETITARQ